MKLFLDELDDVRRVLFSVLLPLLVVSSLTACSNISEPKDGQLTPSFKTPPSVRLYSYKVVNAYRHNEGAYTQGLVFENGFLYEGTGLYGKSSLLKVDLETGSVIKRHELPAEYFGEGITIYRDKIIQLTWKSKVGFVYDKNTFDLILNFPYETEGWGITHDGNRLIMSDGTSTLHFLDPQTFKTIDHIEVRDNGIPVPGLNELEFIEGQVYANVWQTDKIAIIDPRTGQVTGWIDLTGLLQSQQFSGPVDVLNGIAYDAAKGRLFVTGKLWPWLFEIKLTKPYFTMQKRLLTLQKHEFPIALSSFTGTGSWIAW